MDDDDAVARRRAAPAAAARAPQDLREDGRVLGELPRRPEPVREDYDAARGQVHARAQRRRARHGRDGARAVRGLDGLAALRREPPVVERRAPARAAQRGPDVAVGGPPRRGGPRGVAVRAPGQVRERALEDLGRRDGVGDLRANRPPVRDVPTKL